MTRLNEPGEYELLRESGRIVKEVFKVLRSILVQGTSTAELDAVAEEIILDNGGKPAFKGYRGYPSSICASLDNVVVHGIPSKKVYIRDDSLVSVDVGVEKNGFFADAARTFCMEKVSPEAKRLAETTQKCLAESIKNAVAGGNVGDISSRVQAIAEDAGFQEVRMFVGHGVGRKLHEDPEIPNWGKVGSGPKLLEGMVLAVEPMLNQGGRQIEIADDNWTATTKDGKLSAHFEHTIVVGPDKPEIIA